MKADESADRKANESANRAGRCGGRLSTGLCFSFFWGLEIVKHFKKSDFGWVQI
jgi:hypothetical protein